MDITHGKLQLERGYIDEAAGIFMEALTKDFNDPEALFFLASCFLAKEQYGTAANLFKSCLDIEKIPHAMQNLGVCYRSINKMDIAEQIFEMGIQLAKTDRMRAEFLMNIGGCYINNGTPDKALSYYNQASSLDPTNVGMQYNMCWPYLESGQWAEGFRRYDLGFQARRREYRLYEGVKAYKNTGIQELSGKTVIVWGDQGIGDEIMFASCIPDLMRDAKEVIFDCHPRLTRLFEQSFGIKCHGTRKTQLMDWHLSSGAEISIALSSLATLYRSNGRFPGNAYLKTQPSSFGSKPRIGISWAGGVLRNRSDLRSIQLDMLRPILEVDADWYSLQYTPNAANEVATFEERTGIHIKHYPGQVQCDDYATTAEFVLILLFPFARRSFIYPGRLASHAGA
jgi:tetratricopeptide (TPR) repeat protein